MTSPLQLILLIGFIALFSYFLGAGARTFGHDETDIEGAFWAQFSFIFTGAVGAFIVGIVVLGEAATPPRILAALLIVAGMALMKVSSPA